MHGSNKSENQNRLEHLEDFLVASTFLFCDWIDFVS
jgi:hypothetical protein